MGPTSSPYNLPSLGFANASCWQGSRYHLSAVDLFLKTIQPKGLPWPTCLGPSNFHPQFRSWNFRHSWHQIHLSMKVSCTLPAIKHGFLENHLFLSDYWNAYFVPGASSEAIGALADLLPYRSNGSLWGFHKSIGLHSATDQIEKFRSWFRSSAKLIPYSSSHQSPKNNLRFWVLIPCFQLNILVRLSSYCQSSKYLPWTDFFGPQSPNSMGIYLYTHIYIYTYIYMYLKIYIYIYIEKSSNKNGRIFQQTVFSLRVFTHSSPYPHDILMISSLNHHFYWLPSGKLT